MDQPEYELELVIIQTQVFKGYFKFVSYMHIKYNDSKIQFIMDFTCSNSLPSIGGNPSHALADQNRPSFADQVVSE